MITSILLVAAFVLAFLAALGVGSPRFHLGWGAMACFFLTLLMGHFHL